MLYFISTITYLSIKIKIIQLPTMNKILLSTIILTFLSPLGLFANDAKIKRFKQSFDKDSNGKVTLEEYVSTRAKWGKSKAESKKIFKYHDKNKDGNITLEEFLASK